MPAPVAPDTPRTSRVRVTNELFGSFKESWDLPGRGRVSLVRSCIARVAGPSNIPENPMRILPACFVSLLALSALACDRSGEAPPMKNELTAPSPPANGSPIKPVAPARSGQNDDGVKPVPKTVLVPARGGKTDDGIKPVPKTVLVPARGGQNDDGVKPRPR